LAFGYEGIAGYEDISGYEDIAVRKWLTRAARRQQPRSSSMTSNLKRSSDAARQTLDASILVSSSARCISTYITSFAKRSLCGRSGRN
jgi:hypothetical protein